MIIGLTGSISGGKGVVAEFLKEKGFSYFSLSNEVREEAKLKGIEFVREKLQDLGNELREKEGLGVLAKRVIKKINSEENIVIDGIRNPAEILELRKLPGFILISVDAPQKIRFERISKRARESDPRTWSEFLKVDNRDKGEGEKNSGQQVGKCMEIADEKLINDSSLEDLREKIEQLFEKLR